MGNASKMLLFFYGGIPSIRLLFLSLKIASRRIYKVTEWLLPANLLSGKKYFDGMFLSVLAFAGSASLNSSI
jgi:hypothetical protein